MTAKETCKLVNIEKELQRLREEKQGPNITNASLFNLIIYCQDKARTAYLQDILRMILEKFPCRILFIQADRQSKDDKLSASVSAQVIGKGNLAISCEQIDIEASGGKLADVPFILLPHLIPDLPVYLLWWQDPTSDNEILPALEKVVTRLIFDSETTEDLQRFTTQLLLRLDKPNKEIIDMNWARLSSWRTILRQVFHSHDDLKQLAASKSVVITYNDRETELFHHNAIQAIYLQSWLAAQLGWTFEKQDRQNGNTRITYRAGEQPVTVTLAPKEIEECSPGTLISVEITSHEGYHYLFGKKPGTRLVKIEVSTPEICQLPFTLPLSNQERGLHFLREIFYQPASAHYKNMLQALAKLKIQG